MIVMLARMNARACIDATNLVAWVAIYSCGWGISRDYKHAARANVDASVSA